MNPLESRSVPGALWEHVPTALSQIDQELRSQMIRGFDVDRFPWRTMRWFTENPTGIAVGAVILSVLWLAINHRTIRKSWAVAVSGFLALILLGVISDFAATLVKRGIGRLKPHVTFYNPNYWPALSMPSSHAFNTAFFLVLLWTALDARKRLGHRGEFVIALILTIFIGVSRVCFGQHYPLDILVGWLLGGVLGKFLAPVYRQITAYALRSKRLSRAPNLGR